MGCGPLAAAAVTITAIASPVALPSSPPIVVANASAVHSSLRRHNATRGDQRGALRHAHMLSRRGYRTFRSGVIWSDLIEKAIRSGVIWSHLIEKAIRSGVIWSDLIEKAIRSLQKRDRDRPRLRTRRRHRIRPRAGARTRAGSAVHTSRTPVASLGVQGDDGAAQSTSRPRRRPVRRTPPIAHASLS